MSDARWKNLPKAVKTLVDGIVHGLNGIVEAASKACDALAEAASVLDESAADRAELSEDGEAFMYQTVDGATLGDTRVWMEERGCDSGEDAGHHVTVIHCEAS